MDKKARERNHQTSRDQDETLRLTPQRRAILDVLQRTDRHPEASWIYQEVRKELPHISLGTVYRNLAELQDAGLIAEIHVGRVSRWDGRVSRHQHIVCRRCGQVVDIDVGELGAAVLAKAEEQTGFVVEDVELQISGLCPACQRENESA